MTPYHNSPNMYDENTWNYADACSNFSEYELSMSTLINNGEGQQKTSESKNSWYSRGHAKSFWSLLARSSLPTVLKMMRESERQGCHTVPAFSVGLARILMFPMLVPLSSSNPNPNPHIMSSPSQRTAKEIIATFCIPSQHLSGLDTDHPCRGGSSISSTKVKREAVVQGVLKAIPDEIQHRRRRA